jgi:RNA polymerase sigma-70 factor (ECF subfamily)
MRIGRSALFSRFDPALAQHPMKTTRGPSARQARLCFPDRRRTRMAALTLQQTSNAAAPAGASRHASDFERDMIALLPVLRAFSRSLCGRQGIADDMVQNALVNAWRARDRFEPGSNMKAWLFTIVRNEFYSHARRAWRETHYDAGQSEAVPAAPDEQQWSMELGDMARALRKLPDTQREALILVAAGGVSYEDAAKISGVAIGTVKSRVARARVALTALVEGGTPLPARLPPGGLKPCDDILAQLNACSPHALQDISPAF